jgi:hypothetical protein
MVGSQEINDAPSYKIPAGDVATEFSGRRVICTRRPSPAGPREEPVYAFLSGWDFSEKCSHTFTAP